MNFMGNIDGVMEDEHELILQMLMDINKLTSLLENKKESYQEVKYAIMTAYGSFNKVKESVLK